MNHKSRQCDARSHWSSVHIFVANGLHVSETELGMQCIHPSRLDLPEPALTDLPGSGLPYPAPATSRSLRLVLSSTLLALLARFLSLLNSSASLCEISSSSFFESFDACLSSAITSFSRACCVAESALNDRSRVIDR